MLTLTVVCVGRLKAGPERELAARYLDRAVQAGRGLGLFVAVHEITESKARQPSERKAEEAAAIETAAARAKTRLVFDETGRPFTSMAIAQIVGSGLETGSSMVFVIGGPDGLDPGIRDGATHLVALGAMTWPHQLVRIMVAEQLYRAVTILAGHPYHRP